MTGGGSGGDGGSTIRYAPYIENAHANFLNISGWEGTAARANNPYTAYVNLDFNDAFYGSGNTMSSFASLYSILDDYMLGVNIEDLWDQVLNNVQNSSTIIAASNAHRDLLDEDIEQVDLPRFLVGQRDINSVLSDSFIVGKALIETSKIKKLAEFDANLRYKLIPVAADVFGKYLTWNQAIVSMYINVMKFAILTQMDEDTTNYGFALKEVMWPFTVLEQERANLGALQGAVSSKAGEPSTAQSVLGGAMSGAAAGASVGGAYGVIIGGVAGGIGGLMSS